MIELERLAIEGPVAELLRSNPWLGPVGGVQGVALAYDDLLISECARLLGRGRPEYSLQTLEFSTLVALTLAEVLAIWEGSLRPSSTTAHRLHRLWMKHCRRNGLGERSPVVIEASLRHDAKLVEGRPPGPILERFRLRLVNRPPSRLHFAEAGGRFLAKGARTAAPPWGTVGGFLSETGTARLFGVTAAHVAWSQDGYAGPAIFSRGGRWPRQLATAAINLAPITKRWRREECHLFYSSPPDIVAPHRCEAGAHPSTTGLDAALFAIPSGDANRYRSVDVGMLGQLSNVLPLYFIGARSGHQQVRISSYSVWHSYEMPDGSQACIHGCLEIKLWDRPYVRTDVSQPGDSGAWIIAKTEFGEAWIGLLVGGDGERTRIVPADRVLAGVESATMLKFQPIN